MCGINVVIGGTWEQVQKMHEATAHRGVFDIYRSIELDGNKMAHVKYNHLPITTETTQSAFETENYIVWLNGFISNHKELAEKYEMKLATTCDTEVLANVIQNNINFYELNGFFSVVYFDKRNKVFKAFTDRYGIKQLYSYIDAKGVQFLCSELKGILAVCPEIEMDEEGVNMWRYTLGVMNENTIYKNVTRVGKLPLLNIKRSTDTSELAYANAQIQLNEILLRVAHRNQYSGATGVLLSGGIDSGLIAKLMSPEYTFSVDYVEKDYSEIELIKENSEGIHYSIIMNNENSIQYAHKTMQALDDLKAGSCYTNFAVTELASKFVRVIYSGAGGDEFFGGYPHRLNRRIEDVVKRDSNPHVEVVIDGLTHFDYDMLFLDSVLVVEDRMSAFHTMECRYPLLDNELVNFAMSLPLEFIENKRILKDVSGLSENVLKGKKRGFSNPLFTNGEWVNFTLKNLKR